MDATKWIIKTRWNCNCVLNWEKRGQTSRKSCSMDIRQAKHDFSRDDKLLTYCSKHHFEQFRHHSRRHKLLGKIYNLYFFRTTWLDPLSWRHKDKRSEFLEVQLRLQNSNTYSQNFLLLATKFEFLLIFNHYEKIS